MLNTLKIQEELALKYKYKKLPEDISNQYRKLYRDNIPNYLDINGGGPLYNKNGIKVCNSYERIVIGDYGAFVEFNTPNTERYMIAPGEEYRIKESKYADHIKYIWFTMTDNSNIKIYYQRRTVDYADYKPEMMYVSVYEVYIK